jgi:hypothetical protein
MGKVSTWSAYPGKNLSQADQDLTNLSECKAGRDESDELSVQVGVILIKKMQWIWIDQLKAVESSVESFKKGTCSHCNRRSKSFHPV